MIFVGCTSSVRAYKITWLARVYTGYLWLLGVSCIPRGCPFIFLIGWRALTRVWPAVDWLVCPLQQQKVENLKTQAEEKVRKDAPHA